jgi:glycosyltransferase involved in cell wall biosynthesis
MNPVFKYSAVLTTYNAEESLAECLDSILTQEIPPQKIIIFDDFSTDNTKLILQKYAAENNLINLIENTTNVGQAFGRNQCVNASESEYIVFFDDDDISNSSRSRLHYEMFNLGSEINFVSSSKKYSNGYSFKAINSEIHAGDLNHLRVIQHLLLGKNLHGKKVYFPSCTLAITKEAFTQLGGFDINLRRLEDIDLAIRSLEKGLKFALTSQVGVIRKATVGDDKGGGIDSKYEDLLLEKNRHLISRFDFWLAISWKRIRLYYFNKSWGALVIYTIFNPLVLIQVFSKFFNVINRLRHDLSK